MGIQGPTAGVIVGPAVLASIVGGAGALAYLLGFVAMAFCAYAFVIFSRSFNSASSVYAFNGSVFGPRYGFVSAWLLLLLVYTSFAAAVYASTADIAQSLLASLEVHVGWVVLTVVGWAATMVLAYASIGFLLAGHLRVRGDRDRPGRDRRGRRQGRLPPSRALDRAVQTHGIAFSVLGLGVVNAFGAFSGF